MKVLLVNGSHHDKGCTYTALAEVAKALKNASGFFRSELAKRINLRITPQLTFAYDSSAEYGANISKILKGLDITPLEEDDD